MNIDELRERKQLLEADLRRACAEFVKQTGVNIEDVDVMVCRYGDGTTDLVFTAKVSL